eukprot:m.281308 g.281308  ORF g.281308 m.281308 type:complete len:746 (-) comp54926_c0_seq1:126-2363(-)
MSGLTPPTHTPAPPKGPAYQPSAQGQQSSSMKSVSSVSSVDKSASMVSITAVAPNTVGRSGWVFKQGGGTSCFGRRSTQRRWFVLAGTALNYYESPSHPKSLGLVHITADSTFEMESAASTAFVVYTRMRTYHCACDTNEETRAWITALKLARASLHRHTASKQSSKRSLKIEDNIDEFFSVSQTPSTPVRVLDSSISRSNDEDSDATGIRSHSFPSTTSDMDFGMTSREDLMRSFKSQASSTNNSTRSRNDSVPEHEPAAPPKKVAPTRLDSIPQQPAESEQELALASSQEPQESTPDSPEPRPAAVRSPPKFYDLSVMPAASVSQETSPSRVAPPGPLRGRIFHEVVFTRKANEPIGLGIITGQLRSGDSTPASSHVFIDYVAPKSLAAANDFEKGDIVLFINGVPIDGKSVSETTSILSKCVGEIRIGLSKKRAQKILLGNFNSKSSSSDARDSRASSNASVASSMMNSPPSVHSDEYGGDITILLDASRRRGESTNRDRASSTATTSSDATIVGPSYSDSSDRERASSLHDTPGSGRGYQPSTGNVRSRTSSLSGAAPPGVLRLSGLVPISQAGSTSTSVQSASLPSLLEKGEHLEADILVSKPILMSGADLNTNADSRASTPLATSASELLETVDTSSGHSPASNFDSERHSLPAVGSAPASSFESERHSAPAAVPIPAPQEPVGTPEEPTPAATTTKTDEVLDDRSSRLGRMRSLRENRKKDESLAIDQALRYLDELME